MTSLIRAFAALLLAFTFSPGEARAETWVVVHAGWLLDRPGEAPRREASVIIRDGSIERVESGYVQPEQLALADGDSVTVHDLRDHHVLPGLIDGHVHLTLEFAPGYRQQWVDYSDADMAMVAAGHARSTLMAGFTAVRDLGAAEGDAIFAVRDGIERGDVIGPRVFAAGSTISITGGHGDFSLGFNETVAATMRSSGICDGADDCRQAVRDQVRRGADQIKLTATAGVLSESAAGLEQQFFDDELEAIVATAHSMGRRVTAHAHGAEGIKAALRAGVDAIEHGTFLDDEGIELFRESGAFLAPTLMPNFALQPVIDSPDSWMSPIQRAKARQALTLAQQFARRAHQGGVRIAFATDAGVFPHGDNAREFGLLVDWVGMTPMEAIVSATVDGAENLGQADVLGSLEPGKHADLIAVASDPLADVRSLENVVFVMKGGQVYKTPPP
ncbi:metal-dependent hydrolase family protein [Wenzhouxiangella marina]|uniref:Xaa-Pro dipeptidase n=1 Tax=Wenzhouxiangella marina TaxID=1579979 RepID=A0A0K0XS65_9GAMM|nr:amidohydrolase family protein [Wenzhouxiangella marina]AKS40462.1 Xaa-Pro dipeptidase [Wenzhouxiangella marina]MBB6088216.1 imidazolonepropionase-like amidohydrolase [Wenzhouxiangella marina]